jgi:hypothetical protein
VQSAKSITILLFRLPIANLNARKRARSVRAGCDGPWKHQSAIGPPQPSPDVHLKRSGGQNRTALLLIKPRCFLDEVGNRLLGYRQSLPTEMVAKEIEKVLTRRPLAL